MNRNTALQQLSTTTQWDIIIIGGGATGLGAAVDAATRGYKTLLLEAYDFTKGTSSKATKLVHGGVRYLAQGNISLVREALRERALLLHNAPQYSTNQSFIIPCYNWWQKIQYGLGLKIYQYLSGKYAIGSTKLLNATKAKEILQLKDNNIKGAVVYSDGQFDDAALGIGLVQTAVANGATVLNYTKVTAFIKTNEKITGVAFYDSINEKKYSATAKVVINATGVFADSLLQLADPKHTAMIQPSQGVHIVVDKKHYASNAALMIPKTKDGRVLFAIPWHNVVVVGTTDTKVNTTPIEPKAITSEIDFILEHFNTYYKATITTKDIQSVFVGLRPLVKAKGLQSTAALNRRHLILTSANGLVTITGGKWTTYRQMAEEVIDKAITVGCLANAICTTKKLPIIGASCEAAINEQHPIKKIWEQDATTQEKLLPNYNYTIAHIRYATQVLMAQTIEDFLARRTRLLFKDAKAAMETAPLVAKTMATILGKSKEWELAQTKEFSELTKNYYLP